MYTTTVAIHGLVALSFSFLAKSSPVSDPKSHQHLYKRFSPCEPGGTPIVYKDYYGDICPPALRLNDDPEGSCPVDRGSFADGCNSYCEIKQTFVYDEEKPVVNNPYCHGPLTCTITTGKAFTYTYQGSFNAAWTKAFTLGITGGFSYTDTTTQLQSSSVNLKEGECGYFTFLPLLHNSCGSVTEGIWADGKCNTFPGSTYGNVCTSQPARSQSGKEVVGATVFVKTDCGNNQRLPMDQQDPAYQNPGVAQPQSTYDTFISAFSTCTGSNGCGVLNPVPNCTDLADCPG